MRTLFIYKRFLQVDNFFKSLFILISIMINININNTNTSICALYGSGPDNVINVSNIIQQVIEKEQSKLIINNTTMGNDPCKGSKKILNLTINNQSYKIKEKSVIFFTYNKSVITKKVIVKENIKLLNDLFSKYKSVRIFGKGPTFKDIEKKDDDLYIGINQTVNLLKKCDVLALNDLHNINKIDIKVFPKLKFIIIPEYLHIEWKFDKKGHWTVIYDKIKDYFNGYYIVFNLVTSKFPNPLLLDLSIGISTANTVNEFVCKYLKKHITKINFHGIGIKSSQNYHEQFIGFGYYNDRRIEYIRNNLQTTCMNNKISFAIN